MTSAERGATRDLRAEFPGVSGFSARNIWNMRNFYLTYAGNEKLQPMVAEIGWTHNMDQRAVG